MLGHHPPYSEQHPNFPIAVIPRGGNSNNHFLSGLRRGWLTSWPALVIILILLFLAIVSCLCWCHDLIRTIIQWFFNRRKCHKRKGEDENGESLSFHSEELCQKIEEAEPNLYCEEPLAQASSEYAYIDETYFHRKDSKKKLAQSKEEDNIYAEIDSIT